MRDLADPRAPGARLDDLAGRLAARLEGARGGDRAWLVEGAARVRRPGDRSAPPRLEAWRGRGR